MYSTEKIQDEYFVRYAGGASISVYSSVLISISLTVSNTHAILSVESGLFLSVMILILFLY